MLKSANSVYIVFNLITQSLYEGLLMAKHKKILRIKEMERRRRRRTKRIKERIAELKKANKDNPKRTKST